MLHGALFNQFMRRFEGDAVLASRMSLIKTIKNNMSEWFMFDAIYMEKKIRYVVFTKKKLTNIVE